MVGNTGVSEKESSREKKTLGKRSLQSAKSGAGEQLLPLDCRAEAGLKGVFCSQTPVVIAPLDVHVWFPCAQRKEITTSEQ